MKTLTPLRIALVFVLLKILLHLCTANNLGFHRDEFLYLALGRHLDWGFWSNPPFTGFVSWLSQHSLGDSLLATRFLPAVCGGGLIWLTALMVRDLGGGRFAQIVSGVSMLFSIAWLRTASMLQPVPFDVFFWALLSFFLLKFLKTRELYWWWWVGAAAGIGFLNKYTVAVWVLCLPVALLLTPQRKVLISKFPWLAAGLALLIVSPNLIWQGQRNFPVVHHMQELAKNQLDHVQPVNYFVDQLLFHGPGMFVWLAGLLFLLTARSMQPFRVLGWMYVAVLLFFLILHGKSYYTLGVYPVLFAAGSVFWAQFLQKAVLRVLFIALLIALAIPLAPTGIPLFKQEKLVQYFQWLSHDLGIEGAVRSEEGNLEALPQDYADMLGWPELAGIARSAVEQAGEPGTWVLYAENYGQAGAIEQLMPYQKPGVLSFSDSWLLWVPDSLPASVNTLIYVNDEMGPDVQSLFGDIRKIGEIENPLAREHGTAVYLCRQPTRDLSGFWAERVKEVKGLRYK